MRHHQLIYAAILAITGCSESNAPLQETRVNGTGQVHEVSYSRLGGLPNIQVWPVKSTPLSALADLEIFSDFRPGLTFKDVADRHGNPFETRTLENRTELRCYRGTNAILAIGREPLGSYHPTVNENWTAWAFPGSTPLMLNAVAKQSILAQLKLPSPPFCVVLRETTALGGSLWITVGSNGVTEARWINNESARTPSN